MEAHRLNGTWEIVQLPPGKHAIGSRWFMKVKHNADGSLDHYKARLVAKGYSKQAESGTNPFTVHSPPWALVMSNQTMGSTSTSWMM
jgi:hypothetical protein